MGDPTPLEDLVVNDRYWLGWARATIDAANPARTTAADKIVTAVGWFWTVYTALALVGVALTDRPLSGLRTAIIFLPAGLLVLAYLVGLWALIPPNVAFDPRVPAAIRAAYRTVLDIRRDRLRAAGFLTVLAAVAIVVAGVAVATAPRATDRGFHAQVARSATRNEVAVTGHFDAKQEVLVTAIPTAPAKLRPTSELFIADGSGRITGTIPIPTKATKLDVTATWSTSDVKHTEKLSIEG